MEHDETHWLYISNNMRQGYMFAFHLSKLYEKYILKEIRMEENECCFKIEGEKTSSNNESQEAQWKDYS